MGKKGNLLDRAELAAALGVNPQTITKWAAAGMPVAEPGKRGHGHRYSEPDVRAWLEQREAAESGSTIDLTAARTRKELALAILNELRAAEMKGDLLPREEVERQQAAEAAAIKSKILSWSTTIADKIGRAYVRDGIAGVETVLEESAYEVLEELSDPGRPIECRHCGADLADDSDEVDPRCRAHTSKGERCKNAAGEDGYCHIPAHRAAA